MQPLPRGHRRGGLQAIRHQRRDVLQLAQAIRTDEAGPRQATQVAAERERSAEEVGGESVAAQGGAPRGVTWKLLSPARKPKAVQQVQDKMELSERRACSVPEQPRMTQRYKPKQPDKDKALVAAMRRLAGKHPRYGYRFITAELRQESWQ